MFAPEPCQQPDAYQDHLQIHYVSFFTLAAVAAACAKISRVRRRDHDRSIRPDWGIRSLALASMPQGTSSLARHRRSTT